jgi:hypothetical protein
MLSRRKRRLSEAVENCEIRMAVLCEGVPKGVCVSVMVMDMGDKTGAEKE